LLTVATFITGGDFPLPGGAAGGFALLLLLAAAAIIGSATWIATWSRPQSSTALAPRAYGQPPTPRTSEGMTSEVMSRRKTRERSFMVRWSHLTSRCRMCTVGSLPRQPHPVGVVAGGDDRSGVVARAIRVPDRELQPMALLVAAYLLLVSSSFATMRLRSEVGHVTVLRTLPLPSWRQLTGLVTPRAVTQTLVLLGGLLSFRIARPGGDATFYIILAMCLPLGHCWRNL